MGAKCKKPWEEGTGQKVGVKGESRGLMDMNWEKERDTELWDGPALKLSGSY